MDRLRRSRPRRARQLRARRPQGRRPHRGHRPARRRPGGARFAFQADDLEPGLHSGWTVLADGHLREADPGSAERLGQLVSPWLGVPRPHVLLLEATRISGRRLQPVGGVEVIPFDA